MTLDGTRAGPGPPPRPARHARTTPGGRQRTVGTGVGTSIARQLREGGGVGGGVTGARGLPGRTVGPCSADRVRRRRRPLGSARRARPRPARSARTPARPAPGCARRRPRGSTRAPGARPRTPRQQRATTSWAASHGGVLGRGVLGDGVQADEPDPGQRPDARVDVVPQREVDHRERRRRARAGGRERVDPEHRTRGAAARDHEVDVGRPPPRGPPTSAGTARRGRPRTAPARPEAE